LSETLSHALLKERGSEYIRSSAKRLGDRSGASQHCHPGDAVCTSPGHLWALVRTTGAEGTRLRQPQQEPDDDSPAPPATRQRWYRRGSIPARR